MAIDSVKGDELLKVCIEVMVMLQLTHIQNSDETASLTSFLMNQKNYSEELAKRLSVITFRAYKESGGGQDKYMKLCIQYLKSAAGGQEANSASAGPKKWWQFWKA